MTASASISRSKSKSTLWLIAKVGFTLLAFAWFFRQQPIDDLLEAARQVSARTIALVCSFQVLAIAAASLRWQALFSAYGAEAVPRLSVLTRLYFVGAFYNTYLPGAVGGEVVRASLTREAFGPNTATQAISIVLVDRAFGVSALFALTALATGLRAPSLAPLIVPVASASLAVAIPSSLVLLSKAHDRTPHAPEWLAALARRIPRLRKPKLLVRALLLSLVTQTLTVCCGHVVMSSLSQNVAFSDSLFVMPMAGAAIFFPLTIAGLGARDLALVQLYSALGYPSAAAAATALVLLFATLLTAGVGGVLHILPGRKAPSAT